MNPFDEVLSMVGHGYKLRSICAALDHIRCCTIDPDDRTAVAQAERMIRNRLGNSISMEGWLMHHVPGYREAFFDARSLRHSTVGKEPRILRETRAHRLQWLQQLKVEWDNGVREMTNPYRAAKPFLRTDQESPSRYKKTHICNALKAAYDMRCISYSALYECYWHISQMLGKHYALESWVEANITKCEVDDIQEYRHRWLEHLAKEWDDAKNRKKIRSG